MKKLVVISALVLPVMSTTAIGQDASYTTSSTTTRTDTIYDNYLGGYDTETIRITDSYATSQTATSLNTKGSSNTGLGNATGTTTITGNGVTVNGYADLNNGLNVDGATTLDNTTIVGTTSVTGTTSINTTGSANTSVGGSANNTSILSSAVTIGQSYTTSVNLRSGDASTAMNNTSIVSEVVDGEGYGSASVSISNNSSRYVADENGQIGTVPSETASSASAALVVKNTEGNTHGIVVEETKTTISGGINSSSLTLNDLGATFSDPSNGAPIQVHGVADGTADFDATNVRQVYSGLAAVLAATPELRLEPGKTGVGVGLGSYGGFNAVGIGFGHMYDNGAVITGAVSKAPESEVAYKASVSWTW